MKGNRKLTQKSSTPFKLGKNVRSSVSRRLIGFKYGEKSAMLNGGENADRRKLAAKMETARDLPSVPPKLCGECSGWAREGSTDRVCSWCLGVGVMSGDSPYKDQLRDGPPFKLEVRPSPGKGLGTFAGQDIPNGVAVMESEGVIMTEQEAAKLDPEYKRKGLHYTISVPGEWHGEGKRRRWVIDLTNMVIAHTILNLFLHFLSGASITLPYRVRRGAAGQRFTVGQPQVRGPKPSSPHLRRQRHLQQDLAREGSVPRASAQRPNPVPRQF